MAIELRSFKLNKIVIFGVGLIGGSLALALKRQQPSLHIVGVGRTGDNLQTALNLGVIDQIETSATAALSDADVVVIAVPVAQTASIFEAIAPHLAAHTIVTDVGSTKSDVIAHAQALLGEKIEQFVAGHPIAGAEKSGVTAAKADLFDAKNVVLTPANNTNAEAVSAIRQLWQSAGANVSEMTAEQHDSIFAAVSHLPHLLAFALVDDLAARPNAKQLFDFAASGFRDFTRIAGSSPEMWRDISLANRAALLIELAAYQEELSRIQSLLENADGAGLQTLFEQASEARNAWANQRGKAQQ